MTNLIEHIEQKDYEKFLLKWNELKSDLSEIDKQNLLVEILADYYNRDYFSFYKKVFDEIIGSKLNLNFNIDHWAPTFLSLAVLVSPTFDLFDYFVRKGAFINFIGDCYAFEYEETIKQEVEEMELERYSTCLDFINLKLADLFVVNYNFSPPSQENLKKSFSEKEKMKKIIIGTDEYHDLLEQSEYLWDLIYTDNLKDHIVSSGGKTYEELKKNKSTTGNKTYTQCGLTR